MLSNDIKAATFAITDTKLYIPVVVLSTKDNIKSLQQFKSGFKRTINWNKFQSKVRLQVQNPYLDLLIDPSFQGVNILFVLSFGNKDDRKVNTKYYLPTVEIRDYNVMINGQNFFDQLVNNDWKKNDCTTGCLLVYSYFKNYDKMIVIDLSKQQALDAYPKAIQQINFTANLAQNSVANATIFLIMEEAKETILDFSQGTVKVL